MALFAVPNAEDFGTLLAAGFNATLRLDRDGSAYLGADAASGGLIRTTRSDASIVHFTGPSEAKRAALRFGDGNFLSLLTTPKLASAPSFVRVHHTATSRGDICIALQHPRLLTFLTLADVCPGAAARVVERKQMPDSVDWFVLNVVAPCPTSNCISCAPSTAPLNVAQALVIALLALGVRFRLRSVHGRVLRRALPTANAGPAVAERVGKVKEGEQKCTDGAKDYNVVLQNGPKTQVEETDATELVFEATRRGAHFLLQEVETQRFLSIAPANGARALRDGRPFSNALLVPLADADIAGAGSSALLTAEGAPNTWGGLHLGSEITSTADEDGSLDSSSRNVRVEWLTAGMRGRLETRAHKRSWEVLRVEFVIQSRDAVLRELPPSPVYVAAEKNTRAQMREQIAREVAVAKGNASRPSSSTGGFDHAKALAGFSEPPTLKRESAAAESSNAGKSKGGASSSGTASSATSVKDASAKSVAATADAAAGMSRTALNRKLTKREKRKKKKKAQADAAASAARNPSASAQSKATGAASSESSGAKTANADKDSSSAPQTEESVPSSSASSTAGASGGPPCAACGRGISGTYTTANGKNFHPQCFVCARCRISLAGTGTFRSHKGAPHCGTCYAAHVAPRCARCTKAIMDTVITAMERTWHRDCLTCTICRLPLSQTFWIYADKPREPRCADCVGMDPRANSSGGGGNRRLVNLPGFGPRGAVAGGGLAGSVPQAAPGGARLHLPVMGPPGARR